MDQIHLGKRAEVSHRGLRLEAAEPLWFGRKKETLDHLPPDSSGRGRPVTLTACPIRFNDVQQTLDHLRRFVARLLSALSVSLCLLVDGTSAKELKFADPGRVSSQIERQVRHELLILPFYGVFDNLSFRVDGGTVTLMRQVSRPTLKIDAERVVKGIEGVERVVNGIEVLPLSSYDDEIRLGTYRAIYGHPALNRYVMRAVPPIHIVVKNGTVTLEGVVANEADKNIAGLQAQGVPGVFSVTTISGWRTKRGKLRVV